MPIQFKENTPLYRVRKAMAEAYMERSSPDGGMATAISNAYDHLRDMTVGVVLEWDEMLGEGVPVVYSATFGNFYLGCDDNGEDEVGEEGTDA